MYRLSDSPETLEALGAWEHALGRFVEVVGYSFLGSFFLRDPENHDYLILHPLMSGNNAKKLRPLPLAF